MSRTTDYPIDPLFTRRWSPRAFDRSSLSHDALLKLFDAARWAPSAFNMQPWRFAYALRDGENWSAFLDLLVPFNRSWAQDASALVFVASGAHPTDAAASASQFPVSHSFDAGAAWAHLALQATQDGLHTHGMTGFDAPRAAEVLGVPAGFRLEAAVAIGRLGDPSSLPEKLRGQEAPNGRKALGELVAEGGFGSFAVAAS